MKSYFNHHSTLNDMTNSSTIRSSYVTSFGFVLLLLTVAFAVQGCKHKHERAHTLDNTKQILPSNSSSMSLSGDVGKTCTCQWLWDTKNKKRIRIPNKACPIHALIDNKGFLKDRVSPAHDTRYPSASVCLGTGWSLLPGRLHPRLFARKVLVHPQQALYLLLSL
jgi:hypothetical protein